MKESVETVSGQYLHIPVMAAEVANYCAVESKPDGRYLDITLGNAGYFDFFRKNYKVKAEFYGIDRDPEAINRSKDRMRDENLTTECDINSNLDSIVRNWGEIKFDSVIGDFGLSLDQLRDESRGFSFKSDGSLDMRFSQEQRLTAADILNTYTRDELRRIFHETGEEKLAGRIASAVVSARPVYRSSELRDLIMSVYRGRKPEKCLSKIYMSLRVTVNRELEAIDEILPVCMKILKTGGRMVFVSYNSHEDRRVKQYIAKWSKQCRCDPRIPVCGCEGRPLLKSLTRKAVIPGEDEIRRNNMARAAKLRAAEKI